MSSMIQNLEYFSDNLDYIVYISYLSYIRLMDPTKFILKISEKNPNFDLQRFSPQGNLDIKWKMKNGIS